MIPEQCVLECFIDPFTGEPSGRPRADPSPPGQFMTSEVPKPAANNKMNLRVSVCDGEEEGSKDEGVGSLPCTTPTTPTTTIQGPLSLPTEVNPHQEEEDSLVSCCPTDDGICTSGSEGRVRGSELSLLSAEEEEEEGSQHSVCSLGGVARGIERFQGEAGEI